MHEDSISTQTPDEVGDGISGSSEHAHNTMSCSKTTTRVIPIVITLRSYQFMFESFFGGITYMLPRKKIPPTASLCCDGICNL